MAVTLDLMITVPGVMQSLPQWVCWRHEVIGIGKPTKVPYRSDGRGKASSTDPSTWSTFEAALEAVRRDDTLDGVGLVMTAEDGLCCVDLDDAIDDGTMSEPAQAIVDGLASWTEVSPSGRGVHVWCFAGKPGGAPASAMLDGQRIEVYDQGRYICVTGHHLAGTPTTLERREDDIGALCDRMADAKRPPAPPPREVGQGDRRLIDRVRKYLASMPPAISGERGHDRTLDAARVVIHDFALERGAAEALLLEWNQRCQPPWPEREVMRKLDEAARLNHTRARGCLRNEGTADQLVRIKRATMTPQESVVAAHEPPQRILPRIRTARELAHEHPREPEPIIDGILRHTEVVQISAPSKVGKSWLLHDLLISFTTGSPWLGTFRTAKLPALLIDYELSPATTGKRLGAVARSLGHREIPEHLHVANIRGDSLSLDEMIRLVDEAETSYGLIAIDCQYGLYGEGIDENDNADMAKLYRELIRLAMRTNAGVAIVHHGTKGSSAGKRVADIGAGGGAQGRAADSLLSLRDHETPGCAVLDTSLRSFPPIDPLGLRWDYPRWWPDQTVDVGKLAGAQPKAPKQWSPRLFVEAVVNARPSTRSELIDRGVEEGCSAWNADRLLRAADADGLVSRTGAGTKADPFRYSILEAIP